MENNSFSMQKAKKILETEMKKLATKADNFKELQYFDMDKPGVLQTLSFVFLGFIQDLFLRQTNINKKNEQLIINSLSTPILPTFASGEIMFVGNNGGIIPFNINLYNPVTKLNYKLISENDLIINSLSYNGQITEIKENYFIVTFPIPYNLPSGILVNYSIDEDSIQNENNITFVSDTQIRIEDTIDNSFLNKNCIISFSGAKGTVKSEKTGNAYNLTDGVELKLETNELNVEENCFVCFNGISGGTEGVEQQKEEKPGYFTKLQIRRVCFQIPNITRVFVYGPDDVVIGENISLHGIVSTGISNVNLAIFYKQNHKLLTGTWILVTESSSSKINNKNYKILVLNDDYFAIVTDENVTSVSEQCHIDYQYVPVGSVRIYMIKENSENMLPTQNEINTAKQLIDNIAPLNVSTKNIIVENPVLYPITFEISYTSPQTEEMHNAIKESILNYLQTIDMGGQIIMPNIQKTIENAQDVYGNYPQNIQLISPSSNISLKNTEVGVIGGINYV